MLLQTAKKGGISGIEQMADYKTIKYCALCKKNKFVVDKNDPRKRYCDECQKMIDRARND